MQIIIVDTNFLMIPYKFKVDIFSEFKRICDFNYQLVVFEQTINELNNIIKKQSGKDKRAAQFALKLIQLKNIGIIKSEQENVDSLILKNINKGNVVATNDINLKKELIRNGISVVILRQKKYLTLI